MKYNSLLLLLAAGSGIPATATSQPWYSNVTLSSPDGDMSVLIYLPKAIHPNQDAYYLSSRFEHGSMIGEITTNFGGEKHVLFGSDRWRLPHNQFWTESGLGLASEFGVGDDGAFCYYKCGWHERESVNNGVLGYIEARIGEPFLKIGVGTLVKGQCAHCDSSENYKFDSPYNFAELPQWVMLEHTKSTLTLEHEAVLHAKRLYGYRLRKEISLQNNVLSVTSVLTNLGQDAFTTPWYSHHIFTCDKRPVENGYSTELMMQKTKPQIYDEPGVGTWNQPLGNYAKVAATNTKSIQVDVTRRVEPGTKIKAEFPRDDDTTGGFAIDACGISMKEEIPEVGGTDKLDMYAFNLYIEDGTLSPEPLVLMHLEPGESISWTQRIEINPSKTSSSSSTGHVPVAVSFFPPSRTSISLKGACALLLVGSAAWAMIHMVITSSSSSQRKAQYISIPSSTAES
mmetsp:Transcript_16719/g.23237  ORF Transcript_16719/g.23237 Transcript_16719/m.23237 type:complete len:455 (-) Transcript_16719:111-1475(-)